MNIEKRNLKVDNKVVVCGCREKTTGTIISIEDFRSLDPRGYLPYIPTRYSVETNGMIRSFEKHQLRQL